MKLLLVLENHFTIDKDGFVWCDRIINYEFIKRYLQSFEEVIVCGRTKKIENVKNQLPVTGEKVSFIPLPEFIGAKGLLKNLGKIKRILRTAIKDSDCVIYRAPTHLSLFTYKEVLKQKKPLALEFMMAANKMIEGESFICKILNYVIDKKAKKMCQKANGVSYVTEKVLQEKYPCYAMKHNDKKYFTSSYSTVEIEKNFFSRQDWKVDMKPDVFKIIHIGFMDSYRKGQDTLINAFSMVVNEGYKTELTLIGDGKKRREFENMVKILGIQDKVFFEGAISDRNKLFNMLKKSHLLVFPTHSEGLPRTIIEAMSQGIPCIVSPVDGNVELVEEEFLIDYNDSRGYADKIIECIKNWDKMVEISDRNYQKAMKFEKNNLDFKRKEFYDKLKKLSYQKN